jgi:DNA-binding transcriptional LysR family regulator
MTLEQLRIFIAVAQFEHVTKAAEQLSLTQSAASAAVSALEQRHGIALFHRVGRRIQLTDAGQIFLVEAKAVVARAAAAELVLDEFAAMRRGTLVVQASQTIATYWLPKRLIRFRQLYPHIRIRVGIGNTAQVAKAVLDGAVELGFVEGEIDETALICETVANDHLVLVVGAQHPWAGRGNIDLKELIDTTWVLREPGSGTRSTFEVSLARLGINANDLDVAIELPSNECVRMAVAAGIGATVISELAVSECIGRGTLHKIPLSLPARKFQSVRHRERHQSRASKEILNLIIDQAPDYFPR